MWAQCESLSLIKEGRPVNIALPNMIPMQWCRDRLCRSGFMKEIPWWYPQPFQKCCIKSGIMQVSVQENDIIIQYISPLGCAPGAAQLPSEGGSESSVQIHRGDAACQEGNCTSQSPLRPRFHHACWDSQVVCWLSGSRQGDPVNQDEAKHQVRLSEFKGCAESNWFSCKDDTH